MILSRYKTPNKTCFKILHLISFQSLRNLQLTLLTLALLQYEHIKKS